MYLFECNVEVDGHPKTVLVIFSGQYEGDDVTYASSFEKQFQNFPIAPDEVVFLYPGYLEKIIQQNFYLGSRCYDNITRYKGNIPVTLIAFGKHGDLSPTHLAGQSYFDGVLPQLADCIIQQGLMKIATERKENLVLKAPSGTTFSKPSDRQKTEFIKASELAIGYSECQFVAFSLLSRAPKDVEIRSIYVDSSSIMMLVDPLIFYWSKFDGHCCRPTKLLSFGSYEGRHQAKPDTTDDVWLIISASSSNGLGLKMAQEWNLNNDQVITLLSFASSKIENIGDDILLNISELSDSRPKGSSNTSLIQVRMMGENFTAEVEKPNLVTIREKHRTIAVGAWIEDNINTKLLACNRAPEHRQMSQPTYIDAARYFDENGRFNKWLNNIIRWYVPANTGWLIYEEDNDAAKHLADKISQILKTMSVSDPVLVDAKSDCDAVSGDKSAIIISPVCRSGQLLSKINRKLRLRNHEGNRIFLAPFVVASSESDFKQFKSSVEYGPNGFKYPFFYYNTVFVGHEEEKSSWEHEISVVENLVTPYWVSRLKILMDRSTGISRHIGVSKSKSCALEFSIDFAFWDRDYIADEVDYGAVYLTVSSILQGLREKALTKADQDSLRPHVYQHSLLSPENFSRFGDGLLQSCIWRAAYFRELDYSRLHDVSCQMCDRIRDLIEEDAKGRNTAALDLLMGIAIGKIKLDTQVLMDLIDFAKESYVDDIDAQALLEFADINLLGRPSKEGEIAF